MLVMIDNYDSFVYNLVQYFGKINQDILTVRNDEVTLEEIYRLRPDGIIISPGPCGPKEAGISMAIVREFASSVPIFGVCLGLQCIGEAFGGQIIRAKVPMHGKLSHIYHDGQGIFSNLKFPLQVVRYHSLVLDERSVPEDFVITAFTSDGEIMGIRHRYYTIEAVQFHPESVFTDNGQHMLNNFVKHIDLK